MRKLLLSLTFILLLVTACSEYENTDTGRFEHGMKLLKEGKTDQAEEMFSVIDSTYPGSPYGLYGMAILYEKERFDIYAAEYFTRLADSFPDFLPGTRSYLELSLRKRWDDLTQNLVARADAQGLDHTDLSLLVAEAYLTRGDVALAGKQIDSLVDGGNDSIELMFLRAEYYREHGEFDKMFEFTREISGKIAGDKHGLLKLGKILARVGLADSAAFYYDQANIMGEDDFYFRADVAQAYCDIGYFENCEKLTASLEQVYPESPRVYLLKRNRLAATGREFEAYKVSMQLVQKYSDKPSAMIIHGETALLAGDLPNAERFIESAGSNAEFNKFDIYLINRITKRLVDAVLELGGSTESLMYYLKYNAALEKNFETLLIYADIHYKANFDSLAEPFVTELRPLLGDNADHKARLGALFTREKLDKLAKPLLDDALKDYPTNPTALLARADYLDREQSAADAVAFLDKAGIYAIAQDEVYPEYLKLCSAAGMIDSGEKLIDRLIEMGPRDIDRYKTAMAFYRENNLDDKVGEIVEQCLKFNGNADDSQLLAAKYYLENGDGAKAEEHARRALAQSPENSEAKVILAQSLEIQGKPEQAIPIYKEVLEKDKLNGQAYGYLARAQLSTDAEIGDIMMNIRQAVKFDQSPVHRVTLAKVLMKQGQYKGALRSLESEIRGDSSYAPFLYYAAVAADKDGQKEKAVVLLEAGLRRDLPDNLKTAAEELLNQLQQ